MFGRLGYAKLAVKWKVLPRPSVLSTQMRPAHHFHQPLRNRQAETRAAVAARGGTIGLGEGVKDVGLLFRRDADPRVAHRDVDRGLAFAA